MQLTTTNNVNSPMECTFDQDLALVHACKHGDAAAVEQLVKRYDGRLLRIAQRIIHSREDAQDAIQEVFLKVFRKLAQFRENSQFSTWLIRITVNEFLMKRSHRIGIKSSADRVFAALSDEPGLAGWWANDVKASPTVGGVNPQGTVIRAVELTAFVLVLGSHLCSARPD